jgi:hypothetical protein
VPACRAGCNPEKVGINYADRSFHYLSGSVAHVLPVVITDKYAVFDSPQQVKQMIDEIQLRGLVVTGMAGAVPMRKTLEHTLKTLKG